MRALFTQFVAYYKLDMYSFPGLTSFSHSLFIEDAYDHGKEFSSCLIKVLYFEKVYSIRCKLKLKSRTYAIFLAREWETDASSLFEPSGFLAHAGA